MECVLPEKPSALIRVAVDDLEKVEADPQYHVSMGMWHESDQDVCYVCFAGAVMAKTCDASPAAALSPSDFGPVVGARLSSLDYFRRGNVRSGIRLFYEVPYDDFTSHSEFGEMDFVAPPYRYYKSEFKSAMRALADRLEARGQ